MTNHIAVRAKTTPKVQNETQVLDAKPAWCYSVYGAERTGQLMAEVIAAVKDDRMNTKRAISADIASTARVQNQNDRVIAACERELRRRDLPDERRYELLNCMSTAAKSTAYASVDSREFQRQQLTHSHKLPWGILCLAVGGIGGAALLRAMV